MSDKLSTIQALLAKAERTDNPAEAEAFMAKAETMMIKHGIDQAMLAAKPGQKQESIIKREYTFTGAYHKTQLLGVYGVARAFGDGSIQGYKMGDRKLVLIGFESSLQDLDLLLSSLSVQGITALNVWWAGKPQWRFYEHTEKHEMFMARRSFQQAFYSGAAARIRESRQRVVSEAGAGTELVLVDRAKQVRAWMDSEVGPLGKARGRGQRGGAGSAAGYAAGRAAMSRGVTGGRGAIGA